MPPWPWTVRGGEPLWYLIEDATGEHVACVDVPSAAPVIAQAPELLWALREMVAAFVVDNHTMTEWQAEAAQRADRAITKAEGLLP